LKQKYDQKSKKSHRKQSSESGNGLEKKLGRFKSLTRLGKEVPSDLLLKESNKDAESSDVVESPMPHSKKRFLDIKTASNRFQMKNSF
jgi:hypothetical protein